MQLLGSCLGNPRRCGYQEGAAKRQRDVFQHHRHVKETRPGGKVPAAQPVPWGERLLAPSLPSLCPQRKPFGFSSEKQQLWQGKLSPAGGTTASDSCSPDAGRQWNIPEREEDLGRGWKKASRIPSPPSHGQPPSLSSTPHPYHQDFGDIFLQPPLTPPLRAERS